ncbi:homeodomain-interacting protein kinase 1 [Colletotrichum spaethianum]|uniref:Homeodomain-interacting protein kinase 1 n=1 Tax=Colletotrichum spaethianum TaxID=700344 RepID=A0AA37URY5_9PEZI|nr:homeodomain-interacting protein kinase 1 [Colletotrichum spaethianum]GKT51647.1 homeodomain-interacting protein kinase 1 [Colletotrichum spaethianum]
MNQDQNQDLYTKAKNMMRDSAASNGECLFLPESQLCSLVNDRSFTSSLGDNPPPGLIKFVRDEAPRVFLTIWWTFEDSDSSELVSIMTKFQKCRFTDDVLPIDNNAKTCLKRGQDAKHCSHKQALDVFHDDSIWKTRKIDRFCENQWAFIAPVFTKGDAKRRLPASSRLPFLEFRDAGRGAFSDVFKAELLADHQKEFNLKPPPDRDVVPVAVKKFRNDPKANLNAENTWEEEATTVDKLGSIRHKHLIQRMAAFSRHDEYYIMFEWADGGNLEELWLSDHNDEHRKLTRDQIIDVVEQLYGLSGALCELHGTNTRTSTGLNVASQRARNITSNGVRIDNSGATGIPVIAIGDQDASESLPDTENWRHGDLKPQNILKVGASEWLGTLKIADLGLAKHHQFVTYLREGPTNTKFATQHYEAPEVIIASMVPRSRRYDIWSMGCIIFEFVIWLLYGKSALQDFYNEVDNIEDPSIETLYFIVNRRDRSARVSDIASHWMRQILENDPECNKANKTVLGDLLRLVQRRMSGKNGGSQLPL